jgi:hypothetical protein
MFKQNRLLRVWAKNPRFIEGRASGKSRLQCRPGAAGHGDRRGIFQWAMFRKNVPGVLYLKKS